MFIKSDNTVSALGAAEVTLNDSEVIATTRALYIGSGGNLKITLANGNFVTFKNLPAGTILPVQATKVWLTSATAADVIALY